MASQGVVLLACLLALFFVVTYGRNVERRQWSVGYTHAVPGKRSREAAQNDPQAFPPIRPGKRFNSGSEVEVDNDQFPIVRQGKPATTTTTTTATTTTATTATTTTTTTTTTKVILSIKISEHYDFFLHFSGQWMKNYNPMLPGKRRNEGEVDNDQLGGGLPIVRQGKHKEKKSKKCNSEIILISDQLDGSFLDIEYKEGKLKISIHIHIIK
ncbi:hypothetical protein AC249_AIPGENE7899 [Exaiptasia diaphana]|nr:hypothetical protein AC249_AIPGENE7899 [Exaiptasia diaphana]